MKTITSQKPSRYGIVVRVSKKLATHLRKNHRNGETASQTLERLVLGET
jgi:hypothetical protein